MSRIDDRITTDERAVLKHLLELQSTIDQLSEGVQIIERSWKYLFLNRAAATHGRSTVDALLGRTMTECYPGIGETEMFATLRRCMEERVSATMENHFVYPDGTAAWFELLIEPVLSGISILSIDITARKRNEEEIARHLQELETVNHVAATLRSTRDLNEMLRILLDEAMRTLSCDQGIVWLWDEHSDQLVPAALRGVPRRPTPEKRGEGIAGKSLESNEPVISGNVPGASDDARSMRRSAFQPNTIVATAIHAADGIVGSLWLGRQEPLRFDEMELKLLTALAEIAGTNIQRRKLHEETARRLRRLSALREIDISITTSFDLRRNLQSVLRQVRTELEVDAADVLLIAPGSGRLDFAAGDGFKTREIEKTSFRLGEGLAGRTAVERTLCHVADLRIDDEFVRKELVRADFLIEYHSAPLVSQGVVRGVLEVFDRVAKQRDQEWLDFLVALGGQTAIAADVSMLFDSLQRSRDDLTMAYDATIEGWSRALDLRDKETEGHTLRVTDLTLKMARLYGVALGEIANIRWGCLLHDIGKLGVPDGILLKPGPLTQEEWQNMKRHPRLAYDLLSPIHYLRNALDIPYCHHEKWDGTGYPRGQKGEQIPLAARWFAVVDIWDALRSDRPYRPGWDEKKVREHILSISGAHLDPAAVELFLKVSD